MYVTMPAGWVFMIQFGRLKISCSIRSLPSSRVEIIDENGIIRDSPLGRMPREVFTDTVTTLTRHDRDDLSA